MRTLLTATLTSHLMDDAKPLGSPLWRKVREFVRETADAERLASWARERLLPADAATVLARLELLEPMEKLLARLASEGIEVVTEFDGEYPQRLFERLKDKHPSMFFIAGLRSLLNAESIGVVGSRDVDDEGKAFARAVAAEAVANGKAIVSGGARGIDLESMRAALDEGGTTVGFLADSMVKLVQRPQMQQFLEDGRVCLATSFSPSAGFQVGNAMARNKYIYGHSLATVVVATAAQSGGTWTGATEAMKMRLCPVLVRVTPDAPDGNLQLSRLGATPIERPSEVWEHLDQEAETTQEMLFKI